MSRLHRTLRHAATALSLLLCAATCVLWIRSRATADVLSFASTDLLRIASHHGGLSIASFRLVRRTGRIDGPASGHAQTPLDYIRSTPAVPPRRWETISAATTRPGRFDNVVWDFEGPSLRPRLTTPEHSRRITYHNATYRFEEEVFIGRRLWIPYWLPAALTALPPLLWLRARLRRAHRTNRNLCAHCGYDCRATPSRCPECGTVPAKPVETTP